MKEGVKMILGRRKLKRDSRIIIFVQTKRNFVSLIQIKI